MRTTPSGRAPVAFLDHLREYGDRDLGRGAAAEVEAHRRVDARRELREAVLAQTLDALGVGAGLSNAPM